VAVLRDRMRRHFDAKVARARAAFVVRLERGITPRQQEGLK
jgi:hypothetical protein